MIACANEAEVNAVDGDVATVWATIERSNKSITGDKYTFRPATLNSVTSLTKTVFGVSGVNLRSSLLSAMWLIVPA